MPATSHGQRATKNYNKLLANNHNHNNHNGGRFGNAMNRGITNNELKSGSAVVSEDSGMCVILQPVSDGLRSSAERDFNQNIDSNRAATAGKYCNKPIVDKNLRSEISGFSLNRRKINSESQGGLNEYELASSQADAEP